MLTQIIIVGFGIAGANLAYTLYKRGIDFIVIDEHREVTSSKVAAGLYNPVTGRRAVKTWMADELFPFAREFYGTVEKELAIAIRHDRNGYRLCSEQKDAARLHRKALNPEYSAYINEAFRGEAFSRGIANNLGGVEILQSGNLSIKTYLAAFKKRLQERGVFREERCDYQKISLCGNGVKYGDITADKIVFAEGFRAVENPFFGWLPFDVTKGEMVKIRCDLPETHILNRGCFLLPIGKGEFLAGSSYERVVDESVTEKGRETLIAKLDGLLACPYDIIDHSAAVRPTVADHKPFLGVHPEHENLLIFNGMGTKGVTLSPYFAEQFVNFISHKRPLISDVNIERYRELYG